MYQFTKAPRNKSRQKIGLEKWYKGKTTTAIYKNLKMLMISETGDCNR